MPIAKFLRRWFGASDQPALPAPDEQAQKMEELDAMAPLKAALAEPPGEPARSFICREPVLNRTEHIVGYEFTLNQGIRSRVAENRSMVRRVYDDALLRSLRRGDVAKVLEHRLAFIHLLPTSIQNPLIAELPRSNAVLVLTPSDGETAQEFATGLEQATAMGFKTGTLLQRDRPDLEPMLVGADFIQVEATAFDGVQLKNLVTRMRSARRSSGRALDLIARNLATHDDFSFCFQCGFDHFLGAFVSSRDAWHPAKSDINRIRVLEILNLIRSGAESDAIADVLRTEPVLTYKLLRYINSAGVGLQREVTAIAQALIVLGRDRFYRWLSLLLFNFGTQGYRERMLSEQALGRGRFMELLAGLGAVPKAGEQLFMAGMFSLLDVLMEQPMAEVLRKVNLPEPVRNALNGESGAIRAALDLACALEGSDGEAISACAAACAVDADQVTVANLAALSWCEQISRAE